jgi:hypothetical protein
VYTTGQLTNTRLSDDAPEVGGTLREVVRKKILHYRQLYINRPDPIAFLPVAVDTTGRLYDDFSRLLFLHDHREVSELILVKSSDMRISIPLDLSSRSFMPLSRFIRWRHPLPLLVPSLVFTPRCSA